MVYMGRAFWGSLFRDSVEPTLMLIKFPFSIMDIALEIFMYMYILKLFLIITTNLKEIYPTSCYLGTTLSRLKSTEIISEGHTSISVSRST